MQDRQIIVVEPNAIIGEGLQRMLVERGFASVRTIKSVAELSEIGSFPFNITIVLSSCRSQEIEAQVKVIRGVQNTAAIIVLGGQYGVQAAVEAIRSGANACLDDATTCETFFKSLEFASHDLMVVSLSDRTQPPKRAAVGEVVEFTRLQDKMPIRQTVSAQPLAPLAPKQVAISFAPDATPGREDRAGVAPISPRESAILRLLQKGEPNKRIARDLGLTESTVKVHLKSILRKIGASNRTQAAVWAMKLDGASRQDDTPPRKLNGSNGSHASLETSHKTSE